MLETQFVDINISEKDLIRRISYSGEDLRLNLNLFNGLLRTPIQYEALREYTGVYIKFEVPRESLGLVPGLKPGDIDVLLIPHSDSHIYLNRTCALEVKVVRPTRKKPTKSPNSNGVTQALGLARDGFPLVGLIHLCMTEPLLEHEKQIIKYYTSPLNIDKPTRASKKDLEDFRYIKIDQFPQFAIQNQMKKLIRMEIPKYIGIEVVGINVTKDNQLFITNDYELNNKFSSGYFNPHMKIQTIEAIKDYFNQNSNSFIDTKIW